ncbi:MAG: hypothetical protein JWO98_2066 [Frankiales bacterium]|nr:hypothetical protein [Frankiales bacterium]
MTDPALERLAALDDAERVHLAFGPRSTVSGTLAEVRELLVQAVAARAGIDAGEPLERQCRQCLRPITLSEGYVVIGRNVERQQLPSRHVEVRATGVLVYLHEEPCARDWWHRFTEGQELARFAADLRTALGVSAEPGWRHRLTAKVQGLAHYRDADVHLLRLVAAEQNAEAGGGDV